MTPELIKEEEGTQLFKIHEVANTPFGIVEKTDGCIIILGHQQADETVFTTVEEAKKYITKKPWKLILVASMILTNSMLNEKNNKI